MFSHATVDQFAETATRLAGLRRKTIIAMTPGDPLHGKDQPELLLRRAALTLRRHTRGTKLGRRLRRKTQLGRAGSF